MVLVNVLLPMGRDLLAQRPVLEQGADQGTGLLRSAAGQQVTMGLKMAEHGGRVVGDQQAAGADTLPGSAGQQLTVVLDPENHFRRSIHVRNAIIGNGTLDDAIRDRKRKEVLPSFPPLPPDL